MDEIMGELPNGFGIGVVERFELVDELVSEGVEE